MELRSRQPEAPNRLLPCPRSDLTVGDIVFRINANHDRISTKVQKKMLAEQDYYRDRYRLSETHMAGHTMC
jgi:hypothetical protein